jgi:hypothetical protein
MASSVLVQNSTTGPVLNANGALLGKNPSTGQSLLTKGSIVTFGSIKAQSSFMKATGFEVDYDKGFAAGPSSSYNTDSVAFTIGDVFEWRESIVSGVYEWVKNRVGGPVQVPGQLIVDLPAADPSSTLLALSVGAVGSPAGFLRLTNMTATGFVVASVDAAGALVPLDVSAVSWVLLNPNFGV